jgi:2-keto-3-deoxy-L-fuconate dehydrogenase
MASIAGSSGLPDRFAYSVSKGAILAMTYGRQRLSRLQNSVQLHFSGASAYAVCGWISEGNLPCREQEMYEKPSKAQPVGRMGEPEEVASLALFLCSDEAGFITGVDYLLDGGFINLRA